MRVAKDIARSVQNPNANFNVVLTAISKELRFFHHHSRRRIARLPRAREPPQLCVKEQILENVNDVADNALRCVKNKTAKIAPLVREKRCSGVLNPLPRLVIRTERNHHVPDLLPVIKHTLEINELGDIRGLNMRAGAFIKKNGGRKVRITHDVRDSDTLRARVGLTRREHVTASVVIWDDKGVANAGWRKNPISGMLFGGPRRWEGDMLAVGIDQRHAEDCTRYFSQERGRHRLRGFHCRRADHSGSVGASALAKRQQGQCDYYTTAEMVCPPLLPEKPQRIRPERI